MAALFGSGSSRRGLFGTLLAVFVAALLTVTAAPAAAHSVLMGSAPADGAELAEGPERVTLTFNEPLQEAYAVLVVVGPEGGTWQEGEPVIDGPDISVAVRELGEAGTYRVNFRVTSADGHPVQGQTTFELTEAGTGTPVFDDAQAAEVADVDEGGGFPVWAIVLIVAFGLVFLGAVAFFFWAIFRRTRGQ